MAATVDYKYVDPTLGIYGLKNPFWAIIDRTGASVFNLTYQIRVTFTNTGEQVIKTLNPNSNVDTTSRVQPLSLIEDFMFNEYKEQSQSTSLTSFGFVQIEIGESYSTGLSDPPIFQGYDTDNSFLVYNGYEPLMMELNYRDPNWYNTVPYKLPKIKKTIKLLPDDIELLSFPSLINGSFTGVNNAIQLITDFYASGVLTITNTRDLTIIPELTGTAYWSVDINEAQVFQYDYALCYVRYTTDEGNIDTEKIRLEADDCNPKQGRYRLRWANNYDGDEYQNFTLASDKITQVRKGKRILSDGIDYTATTFDTLSNVNNPNITEVGNRVTNLRRLRTDYLNQEELNALEDLYKSDAVLMFDPDNNLLPVLVRDTSFTITDVRNELVKVEVTVEIANIER